MTWVQLLSTGTLYERHETVLLTAVIVVVVVVLFDSGTFNAVGFRIMFSAVATKHRAKCWNLNQDKNSPCSVVIMRNVQNNIIIIVNIDDVVLGDRLWRSHRVESEKTKKNLVKFLKTSKILQHFKSVWKCYFLDKAAGVHFLYFFSYNI